QFEPDSWSLTFLLEYHFTMSTTTGPCALSIFPVTWSHQSSVRPSSKQPLGSWWSRCLASRNAEGLTGAENKMENIQGKKRALQGLTDHLVSSLEESKSLLADNKRLKTNIWEHLENKVQRLGTLLQDHRGARTCLHILSYRRLAMPFLLLMTSESSMRQNVLYDSLWRITPTESPKSLMIEQGFQGGTVHEKEVKTLQDRIVISGLTVEVDATKFQDLSKTKTTTTRVVTLQSTELIEIETIFTRLQSSEFNLESRKNQKGSLENSLR
ncbi:Keratin, type I cytoskeletal 18, partial [Galemys pyrenaicus]